jgi:hypothetical protein
MDRSQHLRLRALLLELALYKVVWQRGNNVWKLGGPIIEIPTDSFVAVTEEVKVPVMEHKDEVLRRPTSKSIELKHEDTTG